MNISVQDFFTPIHLDSTPSTNDYEQVPYYKQLADALSHLTYHTIYLIDYYKRGFAYVSDNPIFLCGKSAEEVLAAGYSFYLENVPEEDLKLLLQINEAGFAFYSGIPLAERLQYSISYDFHLKQQTGYPTLINHKLAPLVLDKDGNIWLAVCIVSLSSNDKAGNAVITNAKAKTVFEFNFASKEWEPREHPKLNRQEKEILMLSIQGLTVARIARKLYLSADTIKFHRKNLFRKLAAKNMSEAIFTSVNFGLI